MTRFTRGVRRSAAAAMWRLTVAALALAFLPRLLHRGMFFDGVTYAAIARNLAIGRGTFWDPYYTATLHPHFHQHPALGLWLQSVAYGVLGDHLYVERLYDALCAVVMVVLIAAIWRRASGDHVRLKPDATVTKPDATVAWLPVLLWIVPPVVSWTIVGNMLETTLALFTTAAVLMTIRAAREPQDGHWRAVAWAAASGAAVAAGFLTKGPVAFFPIVAPAALSLWGRCERSRAFSIGCVQCGTLALILGALMANDTSRQSLALYFAHQLTPNLSGGAVLSPARFTILTELVSQVLLPMAGAAVIMIALARGWRSPSPAGRGWGGCFLTIALCGTLPIMITTKQTGYYLAPAIPFYALAFASALRDTASPLAESLSRGRRVAIDTLTGLIAAAALVGCVLGTGRDRVLLEELDALAPVVPRNATLGICPSAGEDWTLHAWFARRFEVSLQSTQVPHGLFLQTGGQPGCAPTSCEALSNGTGRWLVLRRCS